MKKNNKFETKIANQNKKIANKTGLEALPDITDDTKSNSRTPIAYRYQRKGWVGPSAYRPADLVNSTLTTNGRGRPSKGQLALEEDVGNLALNKKNELTHKAYQDKLNQQLADIEAKGQARQKEIDNNFGKMLEKYRNDIGAVQKNLSDKFPGIGKVSHNKDEGGGGNSGGLPQLPD